jgi:hypothetical protein
MEITPEMLAAIVAVKGKSNPALWDPRCASYLAKTAIKAVAKPAKKQAAIIDATVDFLEAVIE